MSESCSSNKWGYLINHVAYPIKLPHKADKSDQDLWCLQLINEVLTEISDKLELKNIFNLFKTWSQIQTPLIDGEKLNLAISKTIDEKSVLPIYLSQQNTCFVISVSTNTPAVISYFQVSIANDVLMSKSSDIESIYPAASYCVSDLTILKSRDFADLLADLANNSHVESCAKSWKAGHIHEEVREVSDSSLITDWLTHVLIGNNSYVDDGVKIRKKIRDEVNYYSTLLPFRRSGEKLTNNVSMLI